jgi:hypothetical protein
LSSEEGESFSAALDGAGAKDGLQSMEQSILLKISELETRLQQKQVGLEGAPSGGGGDETLKKELEKVRAELAQRESQIKSMGSASSAAEGGPGAKELTAKLQDHLARIQELEAKLAEYEILEDDIADLSLYKEENARLKAELDKIRGGAPASEEGSAEAPTPDEPPPKEDLVAEFAQAIESVPAASEAASSAEFKKTENPMEDFEAAVKMEKKTEKIESAPAPAAATPPAPAPAPATPAGAAPAEADDIFADMTSGSLDTDKMIEELSTLEEIPPAEEGAATLEQEIDTEKMSQEAKQLPKE